MKRLLEWRYLKAMLLAVFAVLLLLVIGSEIGWGSRVKLPVPQPKPQKSSLALVPLQPEFVLPPVEQGFAETLNRPLLVPTRRPPLPPPPVEPPKPLMRKGQFVLVGVILTKARNVALLREVATGKVSRVEQGKEINGIKAEKMEPEKVTLTQWDDREEIVLKIQAAGAQAKATAQPGLSGSPPRPGVPAASAQAYQAPLPGFIPGFGPSPYADHANPPGSVVPPPAQNVQEAVARRRAAVGKAP
jgi:hypothetical protein